MKNDQLPRPRLRPAPKPKDDDLDRRLSELLQATSGMGPSLTRAVEALERAMGFTGDPRERRFLIRVAVHDVYELAVRDAVAAVAEGAAEGGR
jgi:hypothetical protein